MRDIKTECRKDFKKSEWKDVSNYGRDFQLIPSVKPEVLDNWTASRLVTPLRSYARFPSSKAPRLGKGGEDFNYKTNPKLLTENYGKFLCTHNLKFKVCLI